MSDPLTIVVVILAILAGWVVGHYVMTYYLNKRRGR